MHYDRLSEKTIYVLTAHEEMQKAGDAAYDFFQEPHFLWLTGIAEPGWTLIVNTYSDEQLLFAPKTDKVKALFDGALSDEAAQQRARVTKVLPRKELPGYLKALAAQYGEVSVLGRDPHTRYYSHTPNPAAAKLRRLVKKYFTKVHDCRQELARLRAIKTPHEITQLKEAIAVTIHALNRTGAELSQQTYEHQVEALLGYHFTYHGTDGHAYSPIVASGEHACTLHYSHNNDALKQNSLLLIDVGARVNGYAADITRTYAIGTPTPRQVAVHAAVEKAHRAIIALIRPGVLLKDYQEQSDEIMKEALRGLGLLNKPSDYRLYFPHAVSHGLGIDVHESLGGYKEFQPGMVLTVEPGIYIPEEAIGVRIEDDILVTQDGHENLSAALPTSL